MQTPQHNSKLPAVTAALRRPISWEAEPLPELVALQPNWQQQQQRTDGSTKQTYSTHQCFCVQPNSTLQ